MKQLLARIPALFGAVFFALLAWVFVAMSKRYVATQLIPISIKMERAVLAISSPLPKQVEVKVAGEGWKILALYLSHPEWSIDLASELQRSTLTLETVPNAAQYIKPFPDGLTVLDVQPPVLTAQLEKKVTKTVPLRLSPAVTPASGYVIVDYRLTPDSATISGARRLVEPLEFLEVLPQGSDLKGNFSVRAVVSDSLSPYLTVSPSSVLLTGTADKLVQVDFADVPVQLIQTSPEASVTLIPNKVKLTIGGAVSDLESLRAEQLRVLVRYDDVLSDTTGAVQPTVILPERLKLLRQQPERLQYILRR